MYQSVVYLGGGYASASLYLDAGAQVRAFRVSHRQGEALGCGPRASFFICSCPGSSLDYQSVDHLGTMLPATSASQTAPR